ncbi:Imm1 family immunity protein [Streptomyces sp. NPDC056161]|uniref:Imm1 family immunity protein n=1 Tax=Streptomyces sp. NPDC056161 TaxID=3345732 RepID=UPI0035D76B66
MTIKVFGQEPLHLTNDRELQDFLDEIFAEENKEGYLNVDIQAVKDETEDIDNVLSIGLDYDSGYGALIWHCTDGVAEQIKTFASADVAEYVWVSWNPAPPAVDPQIVSDPWCPSFFNRVSAIPLSDVRSAVEAYYRESTGYRPSTLQWVKGNFTGELLEEVDADREK